MRKLQNLIGMPVICRGKRIGRLVQADLSDDLRRMEGVWVDSGLLGTRYIPAEQLNMIGEMAILADSRGFRRKCAARPLLRRAISTGGQRIGAVTGAHVDEISFLVLALEITHGLWEDLFTGRSRAADYSVQHGGIVISDSAKNSDEEVEA